RTEKPEAESAGKPTEGQPSAFVPSISDPEREGRNFSDAGTPDPGREFGEKAADAKRDGTRGRAPAVSREAETGEKPTSETRATGFEQFFEGIRRDAGRTEPLNLASEKEAPLSRNEALREGVENVVRFVRASGEQRASLIVDPPALGRVSVELTNSSAGLEASIKVTSEQVRQLIQDQLAQLRLTLAQQGVQLTHFSVDVQQDSGHQRQEAGQERRRARRFAEWEADAEEERTFRVDLNEGLLYWVA
ncbi:MAG: flagellar hook-length control protein FliK, partial [Synergistaceae bacterium]|nr:flagellar hook-length control protein FliK [Synergistaceae bacterium]